jgi:ribosomal protein S12 methylthiotransferase accessory factor
MIGSFTRFSEIASTMFPKTGASVKSAVEFLEKRMGAFLVVPSEAVPYGNETLASLFAIAKRLKDAGVISELYKVDRNPHDEPFLISWTALYGPQNKVAGGSSLTNEADAVAATLAEAVERQVWTYEHDFLDTPWWGSQEELGHDHVPPRCFAGFSDEQRALCPPTTPLLWAKVRSLTRGVKTYVPAQVISVIGPRAGKTEPLVRPIITTGLATFPTRQGSVLRGLLEVFERDAYMITWLNQLSPKKITPETLSDHDPLLGELLATVKKYRYTVHIVRLVTDAPVHAVCAVLLSDSPIGPRVVLGMSAQQHLAHAASHAIREALRIMSATHSFWGVDKDVSGWTRETIQNTDHAVYWAYGDGYKKLAFLHAGEYEQTVSCPWESLDEAAYLAFLVDWCKKHSYEVLLADLTGAKKNVTPWYISMVMVPELQPMHLDEQHPCFSGERLVKVPERCGFTPRAVPFTEEPHPFV